MTDQPAETGSQLLTELLTRHREQPVLLLLSGGSAFFLLADIPNEVLGSHLTVGMLDERFSIEPMINNFLQFQQTAFYSECIASGAELLDIAITPADTLETAGERFSSLLHAWKESNENGIVIATMGIGEDGHTAGIFPHYNSDTTNWVMAYEVEPHVNQHTKRITVTSHFLKTEVDEAIVFAVGESKHHLITELLESEQDSTHYPADIIHHMKSVTLVTDTPISNEES